LVVLSVLLLASCVFSPELGEGRVACGAGGLCPDGYSCAVDGRCYRHVPAFDLARSGAADLATPDLAIPDLATADFAMPDLALPDFAIPDEATPDLLTNREAGACAAVPDQPCCAGNLCGPAACCDTSTALCVGQSASCGAQMLCQSTNQCVPCGAVGAACCVGNQCTTGCCDLTTASCVAPGTSCGSALLCKSANVCVTCGSDGTPCCPEVIRCPNSTNGVCAVNNKCT
jgi:hypothetical protein